MQRKIMPFSSSSIQDASIKHTDESCNFSAMTSCFLQKFSAIIFEVPLRMPHKYYEILLTCVK